MSVEVARGIAIETSSRAGSAAVLGGEEIREEALAGSRPHASDLLPLLDGLLRDADLAPVGGRFAIDAVFVGTGPGSYTGLRVGIALALGIVRATRCMILGVPSTDALAYQELRLGETASIVQDARAGRFYFARYRKTEDDVLAVTSPCAITAPELGRRLADGGVILGDPAVASAAGLGDDVRARFRPADAPRAGAVLTLGRRRLLVRGPDRPEDVRPLYLREFGAD